MDTLIQANIFFFISSIGFVILFVLLTILIIRIIQLMKVAKIMADKIEGNVNAIGTEAKDFFVDLRSSFMYKMIFGKNRKKKINN